MRNGPGVSPFFLSSCRTEEQGTFTRRLDLVLPDLENKCLENTDVRSRGYSGFRSLWFRVDHDHYKIIQKHDPLVLQWYRDYVTVPTGRTKNVDTLANKRR